MRVPRRKHIVLTLIILVVLIVLFIILKPSIYRLQDNRERAAMYRHMTLIEDKIQKHARQTGAYPSNEEVKNIISTSGYTSPHTKLTYTYIGPVENIGKVQDSQIAYGYGQPGDINPDTTEVYVCMGVSLPRVHEGGASCDRLSLEKSTESKIAYALSCKINWLGFSAGCDKSILTSAGLQRHE